MTQIPPPEGLFPVPSKEPLKVNAFDMARRGNTQLLPLFPYLGPGDIVPCCAALHSDGSPRAIGYFAHTNTVDEIGVALGAEGPQRTGDVWVGPRTHGVGGDSPEPFFKVMVITQRQLEQGEQTEALTFKCEACSAELFRYAFGGAEYEAKHAPVMPTIIGSFEAAAALNGSPEALHCDACGHDNPPFPLPFWGWAQHVRASGITERGRKALLEAGKA